MTFLINGGADIAAEVVQPVLYVFGTRDLQVFTRKEVRDLQSRFVTGPYEQIELNASHWLVQEQPEDVVKAVMHHLHLDVLGASP